MPTNTIKYDKEELDGRRKVPTCKYEEIRSLYKTGNYSQRQLAAKYKCSRRLIQFILDPEKRKQVQKQFKERRKDGRYKESKEERKMTMRKYRAKKRKLGYVEKITN